MISSDKTPGKLYYEFVLCIKPGTYDSDELILKVRLSLKSKKIWRYSQ